MTDFIVAAGLIFALLSGWIAARHAARKFAAKHPELGPAREEGGGCAATCDCRPGACEKNNDL